MQNYAPQIPKLRKSEQLQSVSCNVFKLVNTNSGKVLNAKIRIISLVPNLNLV